MIELFLNFLLILALTLALAALVLLTPARTAAKIFALSIAAALLTASYVAGTALLGRAKPTRLAMIESAVSEATVAASLDVEGEAIYLWLILPEDTAPRAYALPWSERTAEALRRAQAEAKNNGTRARMRAPFQSAARADGQRFYAPPPASMPPKS